MSTLKPSPAPAQAPADEARRTALLEVALGVFTRYGFRKTSMDEVAQAAQISRQGLYLHFASKEDLFRATVRHAVAASLAGAIRALAAEAPLPERLLGAFDEWAGRHIGRFAADASDLIEAAHTLVGPVLAEHEERLVEAVAASMREAGLAAAYRPAGLTARQLAENLWATVRGLKQRCTTREEFRRALGVAVRVTCAPLGPAR